MKSVIIPILLLFSFANLKAQVHETNISGYVLDSKDMQIESAIIALKDGIDSSIVKIAVSDKVGKYAFNSIPLGNYFITTSLMGYKTMTSDRFTLSETNLTVLLEPSILTPISIDLDAVVVTSTKPLIEQRIDRVIVNVDASITNIGSTALEVLQKSPGITVDNNGNISLKGKSEVMIMIDGKPSYLSATEIANLLGSMNADQLSQIEIMTNPSSKYDAAGNGGVINIKTKRSLADGFNGNVSISYGQGEFAKSNNSLVLSYRSGKINTFFNYSYTLNKGFMNFDIDRGFLDAGGLKSSELNQQSIRNISGQTNSLKLGLDYLINDHTFIGIISSGFITPQTQKGFTTSYRRDGSSSVNDIEETVRNVSNNWRNGAININFSSSSDTKKSVLSANLDYLRYDFSGTQNITGLTFSPDKVLQAESQLRNVLPLQIDIYSGRIDYVMPLMNSMKLETGIKSSVVRTNNSTEFFKLKNNNWFTDSTLSNSFNYSENINATYLNLTSNFGKWTIQAGLRLENTYYSGMQLSYSQKSDSSFTRNYTSIFPTTFLSYDASTNHRFILSIGRRIDRPAYQELNPFVSFIDKFTYSSGNPFLQPQFSNSLEISHSYKNRFTTTLNYSVVNDIINTTFIHSDSIIIRSIGNIGKRYNYGITESAAFRYKWYSVNFLANLYRNRYIGEINSLPFNAKQWTVSLNVNNQFNFNNGWSAELASNYLSRNRDQGQSIVLPSGQLSAGLSKQLFKNKASIKLNVRDVFYTLNPQEIQNFQDVQSTVRISRDTRVVNIAFLYRFGGASKPKSASPAQTEEQQRMRLN